MELRTPRDRDGSFEPQLVKKNKTCIIGMNNQILALYARGMTTREITSVFKEMYDADVSPALISKITDAVIDQVVEWQYRLSGHDHRNTVCTGRCNCYHYSGIQSLENNEENGGIIMKDYLQTVTGPVAREDMGLTLPHEHLFNDLSSVVDAPCYPFSQRLVDKKVTAEIQWALKHDPYCCADNMDRKPIEDVIFEINNFISLGGRTIVDATGSESIGRDAQALREVALKTGLNIVASSGPYLEKFESQRIHKTVDELATTIDKELNQGIGDTDIRAGMIGEIGVSPTFTEAEHNSLRAASLAQINNPHVAMNIHMPGWLRRGDEVLDIVLGEMGVSPNKVSLAHSDPSGKDVAYQRKMLDKGVWLEFDMIGLDITFPKEGIAPGVQETADAVAHLIELGYADQLVLSHDVFLKQMWAKNGGNGWGFVPDVFLAYLAERGVDKTILKKLCIDNPGRLLTA